ncbi:DUF3955 domain-containing protein [Desulfogranum mediterraneum]|uniref:DUF3955 domain-containing protein n=1 Tax=Desulfogranum mediterraneum TaxID=160661 RepID=UPI000A0477E6|nr:DUF3955 domain-containing protein [Desulfogranum mediterraneum]
MMMRAKMSWLSLFLLSLGLFFRWAENYFYQYLDENGVLQESWFMPLAALSLLAGGIGLVVVAAQWICRLVSSSVSGKRGK